MLGSGVDDENNGHVDAINDWDFANDDASVCEPEPINGTGDEHGAHVVETIATEGNNGTEITGVNRQAKVMALKFHGPNSGSTFEAVEATEYAVANGADIRNNSWGYVGSPSRNVGASTVDLVTPGVNVLSTLPVNRYGYHSATSMGTPHVTRVATLIKNQ